MSAHIIVGDAATILRRLPDACVQSVVTSPPYWRQRDYGMDEQIGMEYLPADYIDALAAVFREAHRVLKLDGSCWINIGDKWASGGKGGGGSLSKKRGAWRVLAGEKGWRKPPEGFKDKDLVLAGFALAEHLRNEGWFLRQTIVWSKPRATEPPRRDRPSISHEYLFLLTKKNDSCVRDPGESWWRTSVWSIASEGLADHPAVMPRELVRRCIVASTQAGDVVMDPFAGAGTTGLVAAEQKRAFIGIELNPAYAEAARCRIGNDVKLHYSLRAAQFAGGPDRHGGSAGARGERRTAASGAMTKATGKGRGAGLKPPDVRAHYLARKLHKEMVLRDLRLKELSAQSGVPQDTIRDWFRGRIPITLQSLEACFHVVDMDLRLARRGEE